MTRAVVALAALALSCSAPADGPTAPPAPAIAPEPSVTPPAAPPPVATPPAPPPVATPAPPEPTPVDPAAAPPAGNPPTSTPTGTQKDLSRRARACRKQHDAVGGAPLTIRYSLRSDGTVIKADADADTPLARCLVDAVKATKYRTKSIRLSEKIDL